MNEVPPLVLSAAPLSLENENKSRFTLHFAYLFVPLRRYGVLSNTWKRNRSGIQAVHNQRPGELYTTIYYSGSINHSGTAKELDSQAQITYHSLLSSAIALTQRVCPSVRATQQSKNKFFSAFAARKFDFKAIFFQPYRSVIFPFSCCFFIFLHHI